MAELNALRDTQYPYIVNRLKRVEVLLKNWGDRSAENSRRAHENLFGFQNSRKAIDGGQAGLYSPALMDPKAAQEKSFKTQLGDRPNAAEVRSAFDGIAEAAQAQAKIYKRYRLLEGGHAFMSDSFGRPARSFAPVTSAPSPMAIA